MTSPDTALVSRVAAAMARCDYARLAARPVRKPRKASVAHAYPTEYQEGVQLAKWLYSKRITYTHVANEGKLDPVRGAQQRALGVHAGVPDYLIFSEPPNGWAPGLQHQEPRGVAVELKRQHGGSMSDAQREWRARLELCGWYFIAAHGAYAAIEALRSLGF